MKLCESRHGSICVFHLEGDVDLHYAPVLRALFNAKAECRCPALIVDLTRVRFIDSTGIAVLLEYLRDAAAFGGRFCIAGVTAHVHEVFEILRLDKAMPVFGDLGEAEAAFGDGAVPASSNPLFGAAHGRNCDCVAATATRLPGGWEEK
jgi:anti-sigma B factor antagonist